MAEHYDALETRDPAVREHEQFARLNEIIVRAMTASGWAAHLSAVDVKSVNSRAALANLPVLRKSDISALQKEHPPFGGLNVTPPGKARRLLMSPGPIFEPEGEGVDWWGAARAVYAAGFRSGDIVHNSFAYHLTPGRFYSRVRRARARLRGDPRWRRQYRAAARGDRALQAIRLCRHSGFSEDPARYR